MVLTSTISFGRFASRSFASASLSPSRRYQLLSTSASGIDASRCPGGGGLAVARNEARRAIPDAMERTSFPSATTPPDRARAPCNESPVLQFTYPQSERKAYARACSAPTSKSTAGRRGRTPRAERPLPTKARRSRPRAEELVVAGTGIARRGWGVSGHQALARTYDVRESRWQGNRFVEITTAGWREVRPHTRDHSRPPRLGVTEIRQPGEKLEAPATCRAKSPYRERSKDRDGVIERLVADQPQRRAQIEAAREDRPVGTDNRSRRKDRQRVRAPRASPEPGCGSQKPGIESGKTSTPGRERRATRVCQSSAQRRRDELDVGRGRHARQDDARRERSAHQRATAEPRANREPRRAPR